jgi:hypothetical protein
MNIQRHFLLIMIMIKIMMIMFMIMIMIKIMIKIMIILMIMIKRFTYFNWSLGKLGSQEVKFEDLVNHIKHNVYDSHPPN